MSKKHNGPDGPEGLDGLLHELRELNDLRELGDLQGQSGPAGESGRQSGSSGSGGSSGSDERPDEDLYLNGPDDGSRVDEDALRRLLHTAVDELEPSPAALDHLRRAIPARRARKRQALVGAAAAVLLVGTAVPALVHVAQTGGVTEDRPANAGHGERAHGGVAGGAMTDEEDGPKDREPSGKATKGGEKGGKSGKGDGTSKQPGRSTAGSGADPSETMAATSPVCARSQLSSGVVSPGTMDGASTFYGSFRVSNTSGTTCAVDGGGHVLAAAQGSADGSRISVVDHTAGDAATGLPDPATAPEQVILQPGVAYEIKFAWIPAEEGSGGCPNPGASPDPGSSGSAGDSGAEPAAETADDDPGTQPSGSVELSHTPQAGDPAAASATINNACAGTIYRTGALEAS
ncbi:hypothetical protein [Streptomyces sp. 7N604]|uniref:hypothetical protein n=1 Tax=Streptomyces sp. 7N604 TaxID=3457415 RepID=UPI003FD2FC4E